MSHKVIAILNHSLNQLEKAILETKASVEKLGKENSNLSKRLDCYIEVLQKQKLLAAGLEKYAKEKNWPHLTKTVELIKGASLLIQLDTQSMIAEINQAH